MESYDFEALSKAHFPLKDFIKDNQFGSCTIDFSDPLAVFALNKALLAYHYNISNWELPENNLCPPIPGRADYIHHLSDLMKNEKSIKGLDVGVGANAIYPLLGHSIYGWEMVGCDINEESVAIAERNTFPFKDYITIIHQENASNIFEGIIRPDDYFSFTMCNPPFYSSAQEALKANNRKNINLNRNSLKRNFGGHANELWCNGGEALFIKRMIKQSVLFKTQVGWFTCLVSRKQHLPKIIKQLEKLKAHYQVIEMKQGNKQSRFIAWKFTQ